MKEKGLLAIIAAMLLMVLTNWQEKVDRTYYLTALEVSEMEPSSSAAANAPETDMDYEDYFDPTSAIAEGAGSLPTDSTSSSDSAAAEGDTASEPASDSAAE